MQSQSQLKRLKIEKLEFEREVPLFDDSWHAVDSNPPKFRQHSRNLNAWIWIRSMKIETMRIRL